MRGSSWLGRRGNTSEVERGEGKKKLPPEDSTKKGNELGGRHSGLEWIVKT